MPATISEQTISVPIQRLVLIWEPACSASGAPSASSPGAPINSVQLLAVLLVRSSLHGSSGQTPYELLFEKYEEHEQRDGSDHGSR